MKEKEKKHSYIILFFLQKQDGWQRTVADRRPEEDEGYFSSYAHFDIHHEMLSVSDVWVDVYLPSCSMCVCVCDWFGNECKILRGLRLKPFASLSQWHISLPMRLN